jgi:hypothetical protein
MLLTLHIVLVGRWESWLAGRGGGWLGCELYFDVLIVVAVLCVVALGMLASLLRCAVLGRFTTLLPLFDRGSAAEAV